MTTATIVDAPTGIVQLSRALTPLNVFLLIVVGALCLLLKVSVNHSVRLSPELCSLPLFYTVYNAAFISKRVFNMLNICFVPHQGLNLTTTLRNLVVGPHDPTVAGRNGRPIPGPRYSWPFGT